MCHYTGVLPGTEWLNATCIRTSKISTALPDIELPQMSQVQHCMFLHVPITMAADLNVASLVEDVTAADKQTSLFMVRCLWKVLLFQSDC